MIGAINAAASGLRLAETWMATTASNIANADTPDRPGASYRAQAPVAVALPGTEGVAVAGIATSNAPPVVTFDPSNPAAGAGGLVTYPNVDLAVEMPNLLMARELAAVNVAALSRAEDTYRSVIALAGSR